MRTSHQCRYTECVDHVTDAWPLALSAAVPGLRAGRSMPSSSPPAWRRAGRAASALDAASQASWLTSRASRSSASRPLTAALTSSNCTTSSATLSEGALAPARSRGRSPASTCCSLSSPMDRIESSSSLKAGKGGISGRLRVRTPARRPEVGGLSVAAAARKDVLHALVAEPRARDVAAVLPEPAAANAMRLLTCRSELHRNAAIRAMDA